LLLSIILFIGAAALLAANHLLIQHRQRALTALRQRVNDARVPQPSWYRISGNYPVAALDMDDDEPTLVWRRPVRYPAARALPQ